MDTQSILIFQIIADVVLCIAVLSMLISIRGKIDASRPALTDEKHLLEFQKLLNESHDAAASFFSDLDESCEKFKKLAVDLEKRERSMTSLMQEAQNKLEKLEAARAVVGIVPSGKQDDRIMGLLKEGLTGEEIAQRTGLTAGEVSLIIDLEHKKRERAVEEGTEGQGRTYRMRWQSADQISTELHSK